MAGSSETLLSRPYCCPIALVASCDCVMVCVGGCVAIGCSADASKSMSVSVGERAQHSDGDDGFDGSDFGSYDSDDDSTEHSDTMWDPYGDVPEPKALRLALPLASGVTTSAAATAATGGGAALAGVVAGAGNGTALPTSAVVVAQPRRSSGATVPTIQAPASSTRSLVDMTLPCRLHMDMIVTVLVYAVTADGGSLLPEFVPRFPLRPKLVPGTLWSPSCRVVHPVLQYHVCSLHSKAMWLVRWLSQVPCWTSTSYSSCTITSKLCPRTPHH